MWRASGEREREREREREFSSRHAACGGPLVYLRSGMPRFSEGYVLKHVPRTNARLRRGMSRFSEEYGIEVCV